jgi:hypothetical protein
LIFIVKVFNNALFIFLHLIAGLWSAMVIFNEVWFCFSS